MIVSDKVIIDLTDNFAQVGEPIEYSCVCDLDDGLLPYPNASLAKTEVRLNVTFVKPNVQAEGTIVCLIKGFCDRCLKETVRSVELPFNQTFYKDSTPDEDGYVYSGSRLDATKAVCDEIVVSLPMSFLCKPDCKGLCPKCGVDLNERQCDCDTDRENVFAALKNLKF